MVRNKGFTLVELMVVVALVGVLAAIAIPNYRDYVVKSRRSAAASFVQTVANLQAQILLDRRTYVSVANNAAFANSIAAGGINKAVPDDVAAHYDLDVDAVDGTSFVISAVPKGGQAISDTLCATLTLDHTGAQGISGSGVASHCW